MNKYNTKVYYEALKQKHYPDPGCFNDDYNQCRMPNKNTFPEKKTEQLMKEKEIITNKTKVEMETNYGTIELEL